MHKGLNYKIDKKENKRKGNKYEVNMKHVSVLVICELCFLLLCASDVSAGEYGNPIAVHHEWGKLKEVIVGIGDGLIMPEYNDKVNFIYDKKYIASMKEKGGKSAMDVDPENTVKVIEQINNFADTLRSMGIKVHRPRPLNKTESGYLGYVQKGQMQLYARDPILVIGNNVIETAIKVPMRAKEIFPLRDIITKRLKDNPGPVNYIAAPSVNPGFGEDGIYLEGGDVLLNGYDIYVGNSGRGSNKAGIDWLQNTLGPKYTVHEIKVNPEFEHLDCVLSLPRPGLMVICRDGITGKLPEKIRDWDAIEVSLDEAKKLGANLLVVDENTCIVDKQHHRVAEELRQRGIKVTEIPYDVVATWGGAFRCSHHPLVRESALDPAPAGIATGVMLPGEDQQRIKQMFRPALLFKDQAPPATPNYASSDAWAALPDRKDDADVAPPNTRYPEAQKDAAADVFFIHPTGYVKPDSWNGPIDDPDAVKAVSLVMKYLASVFNAAARVYAPRYRQATLYSFFDYETDSGLQALELAYLDVDRAFEHYVKAFNRGRPFILAGHSQGSNHGLRLLQEKIIGTPLQNQLVAAYLVGMAIPDAVPGIGPCQSSNDTRCVISWTSFTTNGNPQCLTRDMAIWYGGQYRKCAGLSLVQVNPLLWKLHGGAVPASLNPGSLPFYDPSGAPPELIPKVTGADASGPVLIITKPGVPGFPGLDPMMPILNSEFGDYHNYDYVLFYESIRGNTIDRVKTFVQQKIN